MEKVIDLSKSVYEICTKNPELVDVMKEAGFDRIATPGILNTVGRIMTIPKGAAMKGVSLDSIIRFLHEKGYQCVNGPDPLT